MVESTTPSLCEAQAIQHLERELVDAIKSTNGLDASDAAMAIVVALLGAASAYLFNHLHWKTVLKREEVSAQLSGLQALISGFEAVAVKYWVSSQSGESLEAQVLIKARHRAILNQRAVVGTLLKGAKHLPLHTALQKFSHDVYDVATGGDFESSGRQASESTATRIAVLVADILFLIARKKGSF